MLLFLLKDILTPTPSASLLEREIVPVLSKIGTCRLQAENNWPMSVRAMHVTVFHKREWGPLELLFARAA